MTSEHISITGQELVQRMESERFGELHIKLDERTGLKAVVAIHSTRLGPALGGARCIPYPAFDAALLDAARLARGMSYKAAVVGLPLGGGKAVLMRPDTIPDRAAYFEAFGDFVDHLGGRYVTAEDSGTGVEDMNIIARRTDHVVGTTTGENPRGDPSPSTAFGVLQGIRAAVRHAFGRDDLAGVHVAVQGTGHVGYHLCRELHARGARLTVADVDEQAVQRVVDELGARTAPAGVILEVECDVLAPCALGGVLGERTIPRLRARIVAGAANNQLVTAADARRLADRGIVYAPDFVINAGGLMHVSARHNESVRDQVAGIHDTLLGIFERAAADNRTTAEIADEIAESILYDDQEEVIMRRERSTESDASMPRGAQ